MSLLVRAGAALLFVACGRGDVRVARRCAAAGEVQRNLDVMIDAMDMFLEASDIATGRFPPADFYPRGSPSTEGWIVPRQIRPWRQLPEAILAFAGGRTDFRYGWRVARAQAEQQDPWPRQGTRKVDLDVLVYGECRLAGGRNLYLWRDYWHGAGGWRRSPFHREILPEPPTPLYDFPTQ